MKQQETKRKVHNGKRYNLNSSPNSARIIKLRRMRWVGHVACIRNYRSSYNVLVGKAEVKSTRKTGADGRVWTGFICFRMMILL
jgi:hypothetical protein